MKLPLNKTWIILGAVSLLSQPALAQEARAKIKKEGVFYTDKNLLISSRKKGNVDQASRDQLASIAKQKGNLLKEAMAATRKFITQAEASEQISALSKERPGFWQVDNLAVDLSYNAVKADCHQAWIRISQHWKYHLPEDLKGHEMEFKKILIADESAEFSINTSVSLYNNAESLDPRDCLDLNAGGSVFYRQSYGQKLEDTLSLYIPQIEQAVQRLRLKIAADQENQR